MRALSYAARYVCSLIGCACSLIRCQICVLPHRLCVVSHSVLSHRLPDMREALSYAMREALIRYAWAFSHVSTTTGHFGDIETKQSFNDDGA